jgi:hypothetical protein
MKHPHETCGYYNLDNTCNSTMLCDDSECKIISSNYANVLHKAKYLVDSGLELFLTLRARGVKVFPEWGS